MWEENIVTAVTELPGGRCKIDIDGEFRFALYKRELHTWHIREGEPVSEESVEEILSELLPRRAKLRGMNLLKSREYTEHQLREKLRQGLYPEAVIDEAAEYLKSYRYIDDRRYAKDYIVYYSESRSRGRIEQDLIRKGIAKSLIRTVYEEDLEKEELPDEISLMKKLLEKKNYREESADYQEKQKMRAFLYRKGFSPDNIEKIL